MDHADSSLESLTAAVATLVNEVRALRRDLRRPSDGGGDGSPNANLLAEIDAAFAADYQFTTAQLVEHSALPSRPLLRAAIVECVGGNVAVRKLGKRLASIEGRSIDRLRLIRCGTKRRCAVWRVIAA